MEPKVGIHRGGEGVEPRRERLRLPLTCTAIRIGSAPAGARGW